MAGLRVETEDNPDLGLVKGTITGNIVNQVTGELKVLLSTLLLHYKKYYRSVDA